MQLIFNAPVTFNGPVLDFLDRLNRIEELLMTQAEDIAAKLDRLAAAQTEQAKDIAAFQTALAAAIAAGQGVPQSLMDRLESMVANAETLAATVAPAAGGTPAPPPGDNA